MSNWIPRHLGYAPGHKLGDIKATSSRKKGHGYGSDTKEQIDRCLNCTKPPEKCHGCTDGVKVSARSSREENER